MTERRRSRSPPPRPARLRNKQIEPCAELGIFDISQDVSEADLLAEFRKVANAEKVTIIIDRHTQKSRGFGFMTMSSVEDATKAIQELNGLELGGRPIRVDYSFTKRAHDPTPGAYMGQTRRDRDGYRDNYRDRNYDRPRYDRYDDRRERDFRDRDYGRDNRDRYDDRYARGRSPRRSPEPRRYRSRSPAYRRERDSRDTREPRDRARSPPHHRSPPRDNGNGNWSSLPASKPANKEENNNEWSSTW